MLSPYFFLFFPIFSPRRAEAAVIGVLSPEFLSPEFLIHTSSVLFPTEPSAYCSTERSLTTTPISPHQDEQIVFASQSRDLVPDIATNCFESCRAFASNSFCSRRVATGTHRLASTRCEWFSSI